LLLAMLLAPLLVVFLIFRETESSIVALLICVNFAGAYGLVAFMTKPGRWLGHVQHPGMSRVTLRLVLGCAALFSVAFTLAHFPGGSLDALGIAVVSSAIVAEFGASMAALFSIPNSESV
jgi:hypothetical protein